MNAPETSHVNGTATETEPNFLVTGIGASAGGIPALKEFFSNVPADSNIAYVVILHLSPDHDSQLAEVLQTAAAIPVQQVKEKTEIRPNNVYVVPPNQHLIIEGDYVAPSPNLCLEDRRAPVDILFRNLAERYRARAVCVVLSGTGANGSMGLKRIKERGGTAIVQNPKEAEFNEMPRNSIATDLVDHVLPVAEIPKHIIAFANNQGSVNIGVQPEERSGPDQGALREIFTRMRIGTGHDFSNYKHATLLRRIERRINIHGLPDVAAYAAFINDNPEETKALLKDLLISVTNFFRDAKPFAALEREVIPAIFKNKTAEDQIRIWIAGCATGEEAYTIAMLCAERTAACGADAPLIQIFATDIDETALAHARAGLYTLNDAADIPAERLHNFFNCEGDSYRVRREIREMILFANHNFLKDPPFSRLDLVSCRNVMIYLNSVAQQRVAETFHFALQPGQFLFLGLSETVDGASDLFNPHDRENHIFRAAAVTSGRYRVPEPAPAVRLTDKKPPESTTIADRWPQRLSFGDLHQKLLEEYAPPSLVLNRELEIVHMTEGVGKYFEFIGGEPSQKLLQLIKPELRLEVRSGLYRAIQQKIPIALKGLNAVIQERNEPVEIHIRPVFDDEDTRKNGFLLVVFKEPDEDAPPQKGLLLVTDDEPVAKQLEDELIRVKAQLRSSVEQYEFQAEELKASNEELQAMNEELRSSAEELETGKEELQSINEEMRTVNQELKVKIDEMSMVSNNLQNLINSAELGTVFLDRSFGIRLFTPPVLEIFNLKQSDIGRPITDITHKLGYDDFKIDAEHVLNKLIPLERELSTPDNTVYTMRMLPYRTSDNRINGVVITFYDITKRVIAEEAFKASEERYRIKAEHDIAEGRDLLQTVFNASPNSITVCEPLTSTKGISQDFNILMANRVGKATAVDAELVGQKYSNAFPALAAAGVLEILRQVALTGEAADFETEYKLPEDTSRHVRIICHKISNLLVVTTEDITARKTAENVLLTAKEAAATRAKQKYLELFESIDQGFCTIAVKYDELDYPVDYQFMEVSPSFEQQTGIKNAAGKWMKDIAPDQDRYWFEIYGRVAANRKPERFEFNSTPLQRWWTVYAFPIDDPELRHIGVLFDDITERKEQEYALQQFNEQLEADVQTRTASLEKTTGELEANLAILQKAEMLTGAGSWEYNYDKNTFTWSEGMYRLFGMERGITISPEIYIEKATEEDIEVAREIARSIRTGSAQVPYQISIRVGDETRNLRIDTALITDSNGRKRKLLGVDVDITAATESAKLLTEQAHFIQRTNEALPDILFVMDLYSGEIVYINHTFEKRLGFDESNPRMNLLEIAFEGDRPLIQAHIDEMKSAEDDKVYEVEYRVLAANGNMHWFRDRSSVFKRDSNGNPVQKINIAQDITDTKKSEQALRESNASLSYANEHLQQFATIASHDLQEPLRKLRLFASILQKHKGELPLSINELPGKIDATSERMSVLIREVLQFSKIAYGLREYVSVDLKAVIEAVMADLDMMLKETDGEIIVEEKLPKITAIPVQMTQLFHNLLTNALKFTRTDVKPEIKVSARKLKQDRIKENPELRADSDYIEIIIADNGIGFDPAYGEQIFQIFERLHPADEFAGTGVGLALCKKIAENHTGKIFAVSNGKSGAAFHVWLPVLQ